MDSFLRIVGFAGSFFNMRLDISIIACVSFFDSALNNSVWESALNPYKALKRSNRAVISLINNDMREDS